MRRGSFREIFDRSSGCRRRPGSPIGPKGVWFSVEVAIRRRWKGCRGWRSKDLWILGQQPHKCVWSKTRQDVEEIERGNAYGITSLADELVDAKNEFEETWEPQSEDEGHASIFNYCRCNQRQCEVSRTENQLPIGILEKEVETSLFPGVKSEKENNQDLLGQVSRLRKREDSRKHFQKFSISCVYSHLPNTPVVLGEQMD